MKLIMKGAAAYEWQIGRLYGRIVHLTGGEWNSWKIWKRFSVRWQK